MLSLISVAYLNICEAYIFPLVYYLNGGHAVLQIIIGFDLYMYQMSLDALCKWLLVMEILL